MTTTLPRPTADELAAIRRAYAAAQCKPVLSWMASARVGMLLAEVDALTAELAALRATWEQYQREVHHVS